MTYSIYFHYCMYVSEYVSEKWDLGEGTTRRMDKKDSGCWYT
jgi:hypothetical protein